jgi:hypothetical protein
MYNEKKKLLHSSAREPRDLGRSVYKDVPGWE